MADIVRRAAFAILVIICLADKYLAGTEQLAAQYPALHVIVDTAFWVVVAAGVVVWAGDYVLGVLTIARRVRIHFPLGGEHVEQRSPVHGSVRPAGRRVQVLVQAGDKRWYVQPSPTFRGEGWESSCHFGNEGPVAA